MELKSLIAFVRTVELGSMSRAASALYIGQPAMSRQLAQLSRELGVPLLERTPSGVTPTAAGRELYLRAGEILTLADALEDRVRHAATRPTVVRIGVPSGLPRHWFSRAIARCRDRHPHIRLDLVEATTDEQRSRLQRGELDVALLHTIPPEAPHKHVLTQSYGVAVHDDSPLCQISPLRLDDLAGGRWLTHAAAGHADDTHLRETAARREIPIDWVLHRYSESLALVALASGANGAVLTRESAVRRMPEWVWLPLDDIDSSGHRLAVRTWLAWRDPCPTEVRDVLRVLGEIGGDHDDVATGDDPPDTVFEG
ncbi:LysR family transcriptional regulator [Rudaeicoccus suwonensis]|uniref:Transcriptional regulator n=1 Tax=Rudaeicoccus suwonensis TaxID=657409 RepID=A0A561E1E0_9MICO|nr:LysR family transcriptional regulator [Rudaeicoccus suwonensis]TWE09417.1 transcriptional regulator [Rudaeicoccus suwonensis]